MFKLSIAILLLLCPFGIHAQFSLRVSTDKNIYAYGEPIVIKVAVENLSDSTKNILVYSYDSGQAEFFFNDYSSQNNAIILPASQELLFPPHSKRIYQWTIKPQQLGIPDRTGEQTIIGYHLNFPGLWDTIKITAPKYFGGQLWVGIVDTLYGKLKSLMDSLKIKVLASMHYNSLHSIDELWQVEGYSIDSLITAFSKDERFRFAEYNRRIVYDKVLIVSVKDTHVLPADYSLTIFPNPFNPETKIRYQLPKTTKLRIIIYNLLGQIVRVLLDETQQPGTYETRFNGENLSSGVYFCVMITDNFMTTKKILLLK